MSTPEEDAPRGRPRIITRERIADAGIAMTLPLVTFTGLARELGVTHVSLYKHVDGLDELKRLVAEEIFTRWQLPEPTEPDIAAHLQSFSASLRELVHGHPGLAPYLTRSGRKTPTMVGKIFDHHTRIAERYGLDAPTARRLLSTVAFHTIALADTVYSTAQTPAGSHGCAADEEDFRFGMRALVTGLVALTGFGSSTAEASSAGARPEA